MMLLSSGRRALCLLLAATAATATVVACGSPSANRDEDAAPGNAELDGTSAASRLGPPGLHEELSPEAQAAAGEQPTFTRLAREINEIQEAKAQANGGRKRGFHVKPHACVLGELQVLKDRPSETKFGVFAEDKTHRAWIRLSNAQTSRQSDKTPDIRGLAVKLLDIPGRKLMEGQESATTQDFLSVTTTTLGVKNASIFMEFQKALSAGGFASAGFLLTHPDVALKLAQAVAHPVNSMFTERFWSGVPFKLGPRAVKYSFIPCQGGPDHGDSSFTPSNDYLRADAVRTIASGGGCYTLAVQLQRDVAKQPVEDSSVEWKESDTPFIPVARLVIPRQEMQSAQAVKREVFCEGLTWNPWHSLPEHRPIGNANRARKIVMLASQKFRGAPQPAMEPTGRETF